MKASKKNKTLLEDQDFKRWCLDHNFSFDDPLALEMYEWCKTHPK